jgi:hypothetical protein
MSPTRRPVRPSVTWRRTRGGSVGLAPSSGSTESETPVTALRRRNSRRSSPSSSAIRTPPVGCLAMVRAAVRARRCYAARSTSPARTRRSNSMS